MDDCDSRCGAGGGAVMFAQRVEVSRARRRCADVSKANQDGDERKQEMKGKEKRNEGAEMEMDGKRKAVMCCGERRKHQLERLDGEDSFITASKPFTAHLRNEHLFRYRVP